MNIIRLIELIMLCGCPPAAVYASKKYGLLVAGVVAIVTIIPWLHGFTSAFEYTIAYPVATLVGFVAALAMMNAPGNLELTRSHGHTITQDQLYHQREERAALALDELGRSKPPESPADAVRILKRFAQDFAGTRAAGEALEVIKEIEAGRW